MGKQKESFQEFVDSSNERAARELMLRGLGITENTEHGSVRDEVSARVRRILDGPFIAEKDRPALYDLLMTDIGPLLKQDSDARRSISMLDIRTLGLTEDYMIKRFLATQGIDVDKKEDMEYLDRILDEAREFFDRYIAKSKQSKIKPELKRTYDFKGVCDLFKASAGKASRHLIAQACGILRIAAIIDFMERDPQLSLLEAAEKKLKDIVNRHIKGSKREGFNFVTGKPDDVPFPLVGFEERLKNRDRIIAKLLHKPTNRTKEVLDHIGFRITTVGPTATLRLVYYMFFHRGMRILPAMNINVGETTNRLWDEKTLHEILNDPRRAEELVADLARPYIEDVDLLVRNPRSDNSNTAQTYRALQVTFDLPITCEDGSRRLFPIEIQLLDRDSSITNRKEAPHHEYVERQMGKVSERVLGNNLVTGYEEL